MNQAKKIHQYLSISGSCRLMWTKDDITRLRAHLTNITWPTPEIGVNWDSRYMNPEMSFSVAAPLRWIKTGSFSA